MRKLRPRDFKWLAGFHKSSSCRAGATQTPEPEETTHTVSRALSTQLDCLPENKKGQA